MKKKKEPVLSTAQKVLIPAMILLWILLSVRTHRYMVRQPGPNTHITEWNCLEVPLDSPLIGFITLTDSMTNIKLDISVDGMTYKQVIDTYNKGKDLDGWHE